MAHYECRDCGANLGIAYGYCDSCTQPEVFEAMRALRQVENQAVAAWDAKAAEAYRLLREEKDKFILNYTATAQKNYDDLFAANRPPRG